MITQAGLCLFWSETPRTDFHVIRLIFFNNRKRCSKYFHLQEIFKNIDKDANAFQQHYLRYLWLHLAYSLGKIILLLHPLTWTDFCITWDSVKFYARSRTGGTIPRGWWRVTYPGPHPRLRARTAGLTTGSSGGPGHPTPPIAIYWNDKKLRLTHIETDTNKYTEYVLKQKQRSKTEQIPLTSSFGIHVIALNSLYCVFFRIFNTHTGVSVAEQATLSLLLVEVKTFSQIFH